MIQKPVIVEKPWGSETIWAHGDTYVGKILHVKAGEALSIQYHHFKDETMYILSGAGMIKFYNFHEEEFAAPFAVNIASVHLVYPGDIVHIPPMQIHSVEAVSDMQILEASTNHLDDLVRVQDRYNRG